MTKHNYPSILSIISTCSIFIIAAYHIHCACKHRRIQHKSTRDLNKAKGKTAKSVNEGKASLYVSILSFIIAVLADFNFVLLHYYEDIHTNDAQNTWPFCEVIIITLPLLYSLWKLIIYLLLTVRLYESFDGSSLAHNTKILVFFMIVFTIWTSFNIFFLIFNNLRLYDPNLNYSECTVIHKGFGILSTLLLDGTAGVIFTFLFLLPFGVMAAKFRMRKGEVIRFKQVALKQMVLSIAAILSTMIAMLGYTLLSMPELFISFDINVTSICIALMYKWNDSIARRLCCCFLYSPQKLMELTTERPSIHVGHSVPSRTTTCALKPTRSETRSMFTTSQVFTSAPSQVTPSIPESTLEIDHEQQENEETDGNEEDINKTEATKFMTKPGVGSYHEEE